MSNYPRARKRNDTRHIFIWAILVTILVCILNNYIDLWSLLFIPIFIIGAYITSKGYLTNEEWIAKRTKI